MIDFIDSVVFPEKISWGASVGPTYNTIVIPVMSGNEKRNATWLDPLHMFDVSHGVKTYAQIKELVNFFHLVKGRLIGFRFKDPSDYQVTDIEGSVNDGLNVAGSTGICEMYKTYNAGSELPYNRRITKPFGTIKVYLNGIETSFFTVDLNKGIITLSPTHFSPTDTVSWSGGFHVPCRFNVDQMKINIEDYNSYAWGQIPVVEIRI